jgi:ABC-type multidrug transport system fused ATPase/permease subunit
MLRKYGIGINLDNIPKNLQVSSEDKKREKRELLTNMLINMAMTLKDIQHELDKGVSSTFKNIFGSIGSIATLASYFFYDPTALSYAMPGEKIYDVKTPEGRLSPASSPPSDEYLREALVDFEYDPLRRFIESSQILRPIIEPATLARAGKRFIFKLYGPIFFQDEDLLRQLTSETDTKVTKPLTQTQHLEYSILRTLAGTYGILFLIGMALLHGKVVGSLIGKTIDYIFKNKQYRELGKKARHALENLHQALSEGGKLEDLKSDLRYSRDLKVLKQIFQEIPDVLEDTPVFTKHLATWASIGAGLGLLNYYTNQALAPAIGLVVTVGLLGTGATYLISNLLYQRKIKNLSESLSIAEKMLRSNDFYEEPEKVKQKFKNK